MAAVTALIVSGGNRRKQKSSLEDQAVPEPVKHMATGHIHDPKSEFRKG
jgi:hypothetical protein